MRNIYWKVNKSPTSPLGEYDGSGNEIKSYGYKPGSAWSTDPLYMKIGINYYFYHNDHLGTPQKMTAINGAVVWSAKYESFGEATVDVETVENNLRFPGQYFDGETGLHYNYHRYFDPKLGRYLREDPNEILDDVNLYNYVENNPISIIDPFGLMGCSPQEPEKPSPDKEPLDDCDIMANQEEASRAPVVPKARICAIAALTCNRNCQNAQVDSEIEGKEFDVDKCSKQCEKSRKECMKGEGFKHPQMLYDYFDCHYRN